MRTEEDLLAEVNRSGFPLQLGVENLIRSQGGACNWEVRYAEHRWQHPSSNHEGFIDLVLTQLQGVAELVVECKRVQETEWLFLKKAQDDATTLARGLASRNRPKREVVGWHDVHATLSSLESDICLVIGEDSKKGTMLERLSASAVESTEALAAEDMQFNFQSVGRSPMRVYFPVIVTTASLKICAYHNSALDLSTGTLKEAKFKDAEFVRFRKQVGATPTSLKHNGVGAREKRTSAARPELTRDGSWRRRPSA